MALANEPSLEQVRAERERVRAARQRRQSQSMRSMAYENGGTVSVEAIRAEREAIRRERARRAGQQEPTAEKPQRTASDTALGLTTSLLQGLPAYEELVSGPFRGAVEAVQAPFRGENIGDAYQRGYRTQVDAERGALARAREEQPIASNLLTGTGAALPILATGGAAVAPQAGSRGLPLFLNQAARAATTGAATGFVYGAGAADGEDLSGRLDAGNESAKFGAAIGALAPAAVNAVRGGASIVRDITRGLPRFEAAPNTVGALGGNLRVVPPTPPEPPLIGGAARGTIQRLADRARVSSSDVEGALSQARANPQGQVLADVFDDPGVRTTRAIAQAPGQTGQRAAEVARERFAEAPDRIIEALHRRLGVGESPAQAMAALEREYAVASAELYEPIWRTPATAQQRALYAARIEPLLDDPILRDAVSRADDIFDREVRLGAMQGRADENLLRYLHYIKMGLDDAISAARRNPTGIQATEMRGVQELRRRFIDALDEIMPQYREARMQWGGLREAEDALEQGATFLKMRPDEIASEIGTLSPFAQHHARIGFANQVETQLGLRGSVNGNRNVAEALGSPEMQKRVAAVFDSPEQAADFLDTLNTQNRLMRNASQWGGGSSTYSNALHGADEGLQTMAEMGGHAAAGNFGAALRRGGQSVLNAATMGAIERANNQRGAALLTRIDGPEAKRFADEVVRILREREMGRAAATRASQVTGAAAGAQQGNKRGRPSS